MNTGGVLKEMRVKRGKVTDSYICDHRHQNGESRVITARKRSKIAQLTLKPTTNQSTIHPPDCHKKYDKNQNNT